VGDAKPMTVDQLIAGLEAVRRRHGGGLPVVTADGAGRAGRRLGRHRAGPRPLGGPRRPPRGRPKTTTAGSAPGRGHGVRGGPQRPAAAWPLRRACPVPPSPRRQRRKEDAWDVTGRR
jgi:hypothetical protein